MSSHRVTGFSNGPGHARSDCGQRQPVRQRAGATMVFAMLALLLASGMIAAILRTSSMSHRQLKRDEFRLQANLLADAGCARALAQLRQHPDFREEVWHLDQNQFSNGRAAQVRISVSTNDDETRTMTAVAEFPLNSPDQVRVTRRIPVTR